ncbi:MAG TPA: type II toxin-antitoxin system PemK/MazF family toxin, partial [Candidatus Paceibacterota bacterium]
DIWWCHLGINIGSEQDGKNDRFERPVLIIRVFNRTTARIAPLTSIQKDDHYHVPIAYHRHRSSVVLSQIRTVSTKRFSRKLARLDALQFSKIINRIKEQI